MRTPPTLRAAIVVAAAVVLAACGGDDSAEQATADTAVPAESTFNDADVAFAQGMIPHHSQAVEMATMALEQSSNPAILDLAAQIQEAQDPEIEQMRGWLAAWGQEEMTSDMEGMEGMEGMDDGSTEGMMDETEMRALSEATGPTFDRQFVDLMIRHHQGAIAMANTVLDESTDPEVRALAEAVITAQEGEIDEMQALDLG